MKKLTAWLTLSSLAFVGSVAVVSCGSDEATGDDDGGGIIGGSGGMEGGVVRDSGTTTASKLGQACATDAECGDTGLICIKRDDPALAGESPPKGMCTIACTTNDICLEYSSAAYCYSFDSFDRDSYCIEACTSGDSLDAADKCHGRQEFACSLIGLIPSTQGCSDTSQCATNELCYMGACGEMVTGCIPLCGGDYDCAGGQFCSFASGLCTTEEPTGKDINALCNPDAQTDECNGFCLQSTDDETVGSCTAYCSWGAFPYGCGFSGVGQADAGCLYGTASSPDAGDGDAGLCGQLCTCDDDCLVPGEACASLDFPELEEFWGRPGYCRPFSATFTEDMSLKCGPGSGSGGTGSGGDGAGGSPGTGTAGTGGA